MKNRDGIIEKIKKKMAERKPKSVQVDYTIDGKSVPFEGTVKEGKKRAVMNVSNPKHGSTKTVEKFDKQGNLKKQKIVDRDSSGKLIKKEVTKEKSQKYSSGASNVYATKTTKVPGQPKEKTKVYGHKLNKRMLRNLKN